MESPSIHEQKIIYSSKVLDVLVRSCRSDDRQRTHDFFVMKSKNWANIIPVTADGKVVLVKQFRAGIADFTLEIPGGVIDSTDPDNIAAAIREMTEETGYAPTAASQCLNLGWTHPNPAILDNRCWSFAIGPVEKIQEQHLDQSEMIEVVEISLEEIAPLILNGTINHALMLNAFLFLSLHSSSGPGLLSAELSRLKGAQSPR